MMRDARTMDREPDMQGLNGPKVRRENGLSLITAIFLLVILASVGAFIVTIGAVQHTTVSASIQGVRAYQAARTGIEWGVYSALNPPGCFAPTTFSPAGLDGFQVTVTCAATPHQESLNSFQVFRLIAVASSGIFGSPNFASRQIEATVTNAP